MRCFTITLTLLLASAIRADIVDCACDVTRPETLQARQCSLCNEAEKQPAGIAFFHLKDASSNKPNRWLTLARTHERSLDLLSAERRADLWNAAITRAKILFGEEWAVAYNAPALQTQCHIHLHIGRLIPGVETSQFIVATKIEDIPAPADGEGVWIHPAGNLFHVHTGERITETVLER